MVKFFPLWGWPGRHIWRLAIIWFLPTVQQSVVMLGELLWFGLRMEWIMKHQEQAQIVYNSRIIQQKNRKEFYEKITSIESSLHFSTWSLQHFNSVLIKVFFNNASTVSGLCCKRAKEVCSVSCLILFKAFRLLFLSDKGSERMLTSRANFYQTKLKIYKNERI